MASYEDLLVEFGGNNEEVSLESQAPLFSTDWDSVITETAQNYPNVPEQLVRSLIQRESSGDPYADIDTRTKWGKARGLGQFIDETAKRYIPDWKDPSDSYDPVKNIKGIYAYLDDLVKETGSLEKALIKYHGGSIDILGTKSEDYAKQILSKVKGDVSFKPKSSSYEDLLAEFGGVTEQVTEQPTEQVVSSSDIKTPDSFLNKLGQSATSSIAGLESSIAASPGLATDAILALSNNINKAINFFTDKTFNKKLLSENMKAPEWTYDIASKAKDKLSTNNKAVNNLLDSFSSKELKNIQQNTSQSAKMTEEGKGIVGSLWEKIQKGEITDAAEYLTYATVESGVQNILAGVISAYTANPTIGLSLLAGVSASDKMREYVDNGNSTDDRTMQVLNSINTGLMEYAGEKMGTFEILKPLRNKFFKIAADEGVDKAKKTITKPIIETLKNIAKNTGKEVPSEIFTQLGQNLGDIIAGDKEMTLKDAFSGVADAGLLAITSSGPMTTLGSISETKQNIRQQELQAVDEQGNPVSTMTEPAQQLMEQDDIVDESPVIESFKMTEDDLLSRYEYDKEGRDLLKSAVISDPKINEETRTRLLSEMDSIDNTTEEVIDEEESQETETLLNEQQPTVEPQSSQEATTPIPTAEVSPNADLPSVETATEQPQPQEDIPANNDVPVSTTTTTEGTVQTPPITATIEEEQASQPVTSPSLTNGITTDETANVIPSYIVKRDDGTVVVDKRNITNNEPLLSLLNPYKQEEFTVEDIKNLLVNEYSKLYKFKTGAEKNIGKLEIIENLYKDINENVETVSKEYFIEGVKGAYGYNNKQVQVVTELINNLKIDKFPKVTIEKLTGKNSPNNFYVFSKNILSSDTPDALMHEIGHYSFFNVLSSNERLEYMKYVIDRFYGTGKSIDSDLAYKNIETGDSTVAYSNVGDDFTEYFAEQFRQYVIENKVTDSQFKTLFSRLKEYLDAVLKAFRKTGYNKDLVKYFDKIIDGKKTNVDFVSVGKEIAIKLDNAKFDDVIEEDGEQLLRFNVIQPNKRKTTVTIPLSGNATALRIAIRAEEAEFKADKGGSVSGGMRRAKQKRIAETGDERSIWKIEREKIINEIIDDGRVEFVDGKHNLPKNQGGIIESITPDGTVSFYNQTLQNNLEVVNENGKLYIQPKVKKLVNKKGEVVEFDPLSELKTMASGSKKNVSYNENINRDINEDKTNEELNEEVRKKEEATDKLLETSDETRTKLSEKERKQFAEEQLAELTKDLRNNKITEDEYNDKVDAIYGYLTETAIKANVTEIKKKRKPPKRYTQQEKEELYIRDWLNLKNGSGNVKVRFYDFVNKYLYGAGANSYRRQIFELIKEIKDNNDPLINKAIELIDEAIEFRKVSKEFTKLKEFTRRKSVKSNLKEENSDMNDINERIAKIGKKYQLFVDYQTLKRLKDRGGEVIKPKVVADTVRRLRGSDKYVVVNKETNKITTSERFDTKEAAREWVNENSEKVSSKTGAKYESIINQGLVEPISKTDKKRAEKLGLPENTEFDFYSIIKTDDVKKKITEIKRTLTDGNGKMFDAEKIGIEVNKIKEDYRNLIETSTKFKTEKDIQNEKIVDELSEQIKSKPRSKKKEKIARIWKYAENPVAKWMSPRSYVAVNMSYKLQELDRYKKGGLFQKYIEKAIHENRNNVYDNINKISDNLKYLMEKYDISEKDIRAMSDQVSLGTVERALAGDNKKKRTVKFEHGEVELTEAHEVALYLIARNERGYKHLTEGGIALNKDDTPLKLTDKDILNIKLNDRQKKLVKVLEGHFKLQSEIGNSVSMEDVGEKIFNEPNYFPLLVLNDYLAKDNTSIDATDAMNKVREVFFKGNPSITKERKNSGAPIYLEDPFIAMGRTTSLFNQYMDLVMVSNKIWKIVNNDTLAKAMSDANYKPEYDALRDDVSQLMTVKIRDSSEDALRIFNSIFTVAVLGYKASTALTQPLATFLYFPEMDIDFDLFVKSAIDVRNWYGKASIKEALNLKKEIEKESPYLKFRFENGMDVVKVGSPHRATAARMLFGGKKFIKGKNVFDLATNLAKTALSSQGAMSWIQSFDTGGILGIWKLCEIEAIAKGYKRGTSQFKKYVARRTEEITIRTQQTFDPFDNSPLSRSSIGRLTTRFLSQALKTSMMLRKQFFKLYDKTTSFKEKRNAAAAIMLIIASQSIGPELLKAVIKNTGEGWEEDEEKMTSDLLKALASNIATNFSIPGIIVGGVIQGYSNVGGGNFGAFTERIGNSVKKIGKAVTDWDRENFILAVYELAKSVSALGGIEEDTKFIIGLADLLNIGR